MGTSLIGEGSSCVIRTDRWSPAAMDRCVETWKLEEVIWGV